MVLGPGRALGSSGLVWDVSSAGVSAPSFLHCFTLASTAFNLQVATPGVSPATLSLTSLSGARPGQCDPSGIVKLCPDCGKGDLVIAGRCLPVRARMAQTFLQEGLQPLMAWDPGGHSSDMIVFITLHISRWVGPLFLLYRRETEDL